MQEETKITLRVKKSEWEAFKRIAKELESDASKELRKFIKRFIRDNRDLIEKLF